MEQTASRAEGWCGHLLTRPRFPEPSTPRKQRLHGSRHLDPAAGWQRRLGSAPAVRFLAQVLDCIGVSRYAIGMLAHNIHSKVRLTRIINDLRFLVRIMSIVSSRVGAPAIGPSPCGPALPGARADGRSVRSMLTLPYAPRSTLAARPSQRGRRRLPRPQSAHPLPGRRALASPILSRRQEPCPCWI